MSLASSLPTKAGRAFNQYFVNLRTEGSQLKRCAGQTVLGNTLEYDDRKHGANCNG